MKTAFTTTLDPRLLLFVAQEAKKQKVNRNEILEKALKLYRNLKLQMEVEEGFKDEGRKEEYRGVSHEFLAAQRHLLEKL